MSRLRDVYPCFKLSQSLPNPYRGDARRVTTGQCRTLLLRSNSFTFTWMLRELRGSPHPIGSFKAYPPPKPPVNQRELAFPRPAVRSAILQVDRLNATTAQIRPCGFDLFFAAAAISILVGAALLLGGERLDQLSRLTIILMFALGAGAFSAAVGVLQCRKWASGSLSSGLR
jgi:hypothetical protein